eukprot:77311-Ditylum_brightwellii.AAC.1
MQYPLAVTFSKAHCLQIMKPFTRAILPKLGFHRNTVQEIVYGAAKFGSIQFAHLYVEQGYLAIKHLIGHVWECPTTQHVNDHILMGVFERRKLLQDTLATLNVVRLYLGVLTLADITNDNGTHIMA